MAADTAMVGEASCVLLTPLRQPRACKGNYPPLSPHSPYRESQLTVCEERLARRILSGALYTEGDAEPRLCYVSELA